MHKLSHEILSFYRQSEESKRLTDTVLGQLEFVRTQEIITRYLPPAPAVVLDIGGGSGPYACWLAKKGYEVHLVEPVDLHVKQAKEASKQQAETPIASVSLGDARSLHFREFSADAALLLGPLYHLIDEGDRLLALREAHRTLQNRGIIFAAGISRFAPLLDCFFQDKLSNPVSKDIVQNDIETGYHRNPTDNLELFTDAYLHRPEMLGAELVQAGFQHRGTLAVEGMAWIFESVKNYWTVPVQRNAVLEMIRKCETEPSILGVSAHILSIGIKE